MSLPTNIDVVCKKCGATIVTAEVDVSTILTCIVCSGGIMNKQKEPKQ